MHVHVMQRGLQWYQLPDRQCVHCLLSLERGRERRQLLLRQRWHYWWNLWLVHVYIMRRGVRRCELPDFQYMFGKRVRVLECVHDLPGRHDKRLRG